MTYCTQIWVLSQAETLITIVGPFRKSRQIHKITTIFTKKGPDWFFFENEICVILWIYYSFGIFGTFIMTRIILEILCMSINLNWKLHDLSFITECCKISPGIITWRLTWWKSSWVVEYNKFPRVNQHIAKSRSSGSYWDFNART